MLGVFPDEKEEDVGRKVLMGKGYIYVFVDRLVLVKYGRYVQREQIEGLRLPRVERPCFTLEGTCSRTFHVRVVSSCCVLISMIGLVWIAFLVFS